MLLGAGLAMCGASFGRDVNPFEQSQDAALLVEETLLEALLGASTTAAIAPPSKAKVTINRDELTTHEPQIDPTRLGFVHRVETGGDRR